MKKYITILAAAVVLAACGNQENKEQQVKKLEKEMTELTQKKKELDKKIKEVETKLSALQNNDESASKSLGKEVKTELTSAKTFIHRVEIQGLVNSDYNVTIAAENGGKVMSVLVKAGQKVTKGQKLAQLDGSILAANIAELKTRLDLVEKTYRKQESLYKQNIGSELQYLQAKNQYEALQDQLKALNTQYAKFSIVAPFAGSVDEVFIKEGEMTAPGTPAIRVVNLGEMKVEADISERYVGVFNAGDVVRIYFPALKDTIVAKISAVGQVINPANRTFKITIPIVKNDSRLKPNLLAVIQAVDFKAENAITVPANLILTRGNVKSLKVATYKDNKWYVTTKEIEPGYSSNGRLHIKSGLSVGEHVIITGYQNVEDGDLLIIK